MKKNGLAQIIFLKRAFLALVFALLMPCQSGAIEDYFRLSEAAVGKDIGSFRLIDQDGKAFQIKELAGKPVVINFIYTTCGHTCGTLTSRLGGMFDDEKSGLGEKFTALTIGFEAGKDNPQAMKAFGKNFTSSFKAWKFASADKETIKTLTKETGFYFKRTGNGFEHPNIVTVIGPDSRIFGHVYGIEFNKDLLLEYIERSMDTKSPSYGTKRLQPLGLLDRIKLLCYNFDPVTGTYKPDYFFLMALALGVIANAILLSIGLYIFSSSRSRARRA